jgi:hypothetical protein
LRSGPSLLCSTGIRARLPAVPNIDATWTRHDGIIYAILTRILIITVPFQLGSEDLGVRVCVPALLCLLGFLHFRRSEDSRPAAESRPARNARNIFRAQLQPSQRCPAPKSFERKRELCGDYTDIEEASLMSWSKQLVLPRGALYIRFHCVPFINDFPCPVQVSDSTKSKSTLRYSVV